jgi:hypothetical protein
MNSVFAQQKAAQTIPNHALWTDLLQKNVKNGVVNYKNFQKDSVLLNAYCAELSKYPAKEDWDKNERFAYWINAYNVFTIRTIIRHYPLKSIKDIPKVWDKKDIVLAGKKYSLNAIENDILRPKFKDARVHAAINCASKSCPPLRSRAFTAENLDLTLDEQCALFVNSAFHNDIQAKKWSLSPIFLWFILDFKNVKTFVKTHYKGKTTLDKNPIITYKTYDWALNE